MLRSSVRSAIRDLTLDLAALVWPTECVSCAAPDRDCCASCLGELRRTTPVRPLSLGVPAFVFGPYEGPCRALLVAFKHDNRFGFRRTLGALLRGPLTAGLSLARSAQGPLIVTVPSRPSRVRRRGYRHVDVLARMAMRGTTLRTCRALRTTRGRVGQVGLGSEGRALNAARIAVRRAFGAKVRGREVVLVDDIVTTGATVFAAREALENAGATVIAIVALCVAERRDTRRGNESGNGESEWSRLPERRKGAPHWPTA